MRMVYIPVISEGKLSPETKNMLIDWAEGRGMRKTESQIRDNFMESIEDAEEVLKSDADRDAKLMAYGAGMLMVTKCREWYLLRENELDVIENRLDRLRDEI